MATLQDLISQVEDAALRDRLQEEAERLLRQKKFGLVFEEHLPEVTPLYDVPVRVGAFVAPKTGYMKDIYEVLRIDNENAVCRLEDSVEEKTLPLSDIVTVARFGEAIYPCLKKIDTVENAPDSELWHTLIEADNYHALQLLEYLYDEKVDCIYIDPPYNTGARDWKYNNNYVDGNDAYRHSKWVSMMEKRLKLAKRLLNPMNGVMVAAIDDNEINTFGLLLDEIFNGYKKFCVTVIHNPSGNQGKNFGITNEFLYFVLPSNAQILNLENRTDEPDIRPLRDVSGNNNLRTDAKNCFYPIIVKNGTIIGFGDVCENEFHPISPNIARTDGTIEIYPIDAKGIEKKWVFARNTVESIIDELHVEWNSQRKIYDIIRYKTHFTYKTVWSKKAFNSNSYGSKLIAKLFSDKRFDYPKSLYAVYECIKAACGNKPTALILDFFAGSGTTLHAVNLLNAEDGGNRRCILVTNNEVSDAEAKSLAKQGYKPGDEEWEKLGIARYVTWPRTVCSIEGHDVNGVPLKGDYGVQTEKFVKCTDEDMDEEEGKKGRTVFYKKVKEDVYPELAGRKMADGFKTNAIYFKLGFLDKNAVALGTQFSALLSTLWMKAGAIGSCPELSAEKLPDMLILPQNHFAVLLNERIFSRFMEKMETVVDIRAIFFVTDSDTNFRKMRGHFPKAESYQLYRDYLSNFRINTGRR